MTNYFIALPVSPVLKNISETLVKKGVQAQWIEPSDWHITLRFLGPVQDDRLRAVEDILHRIRRPLFHIEISGLGSFKKKNQSILYMNVTSTRKLTTLCADITDLLTPFDFDFGMREFVPHVTVARLKNTRGLESYIARHSKNIAATWQADRFFLMRSGDFDHRGSRYKGLAEYPLIS